MIGSSPGRDYQSPPLTYRSVIDVIPSSVVTCFNTPRSGRSPRKSIQGLIALQVPAEDFAFAQKVRSVKITAKEVFSAVRHGNREKFQQAVDTQDFDVNTRDEHGNTLFIVACQNGQ